MLSYALRSALHAPFGIPPTSLHITNSASAIFIDQQCNISDT